MQLIIITILFIIGFVIWAITVVISDFYSKREESKKIKSEFNKKYPNRITNKDLSLFERNKDIIDKYLRGVINSNHSYYIDNITRDCLNDICIAEKRGDIRPNTSYLSTWKNNAPEEWRELSMQIKNIFLSKKEKLEEKSRLKKEKEQKDRIVALSKKYRDLIEQFNEVAYRKVTSIDDYGEENWDVLSKEADILIAKIGKKEGQGDDCIKQWKKSEWRIPIEYKEIKNNLLTSFKSYYNARKNEGAKSQDVSKMSGVDFENHIADLLRKNGFTNIVGTPKTGDQGADLIAKKNNKTVIIQAKRYENSVGNKAVQEVIGAIRFYNGDEGWVITNSKFTKSARELADKNNIKLIDGSDLEIFHKIA